MDDFDFDYDSVPEGAQIITPDMMQKRIIWDVAPDDLATQVVSHLGLNPASPDVEEMEKAEAYRRLGHITPITPFIGALAKYAAETVRSAMIVRHGESAAESPSFEVDVLTQFIAQSSLGIIAELVDVGAIYLPEFEIQQESSDHE